MTSKKTLAAATIAICALVGIVVFVSYHFARKGSSAKAQSQPSASPIRNLTGPAAATLAGNGCANGRCSPLLTLRRTSLATVAATPSTSKPTVLSKKPPGVLSACGNNRYVVLTFDDGPFTAPNMHNNKPSTAFVLDELKAAGLKGTFFLSPGGQEGHYGPEECQVLKRAVAEGHEVQWHTWSHADLTLPTTNIQAEVQRCRDWVKNDCVFQPSPGSFTMLRPPFGYTNGKADAELNALDLTSTLWNIDTRDWQGSSLEQIQASIKADNQAPSAVILMHDRWYQPGMVAWIKQQFADHQFVTASHCYQDCGATRC